MFFCKEWGTLMRIASLVKVALLAGVVALPASFSVADAKAKPLPPGACAFEKKFIAVNTVCSFQCNAATQWCSQQLCLNGQTVAVIPCYGSFCTPKCGG
jgi:hypothetical protein